MKISTTEEYQAGCDLLDVLVKLRVQSADKSLGDFVYDFEDDWASCDSCDCAKCECSCDDESLHSRYYDADDGDRAYDEWKDRQLEQKWSVESKDGDTES